SWRSATRPRRCVPACSGRPMPRRSLSWQNEGIMSDQDTAASEEPSLLDRILGTGKGAAGGLQTPATVADKAPGVGEKVAGWLGNTARAGGAGADVARSGEAGAEAATAGSELGAAASTASTLSRVAGGIGAVGGVLQLGMAANDVAKGDYEQAALDG